MTKDYSKILEEAEKQVSGIKDDKLREIAFSKLITHLFDSNDSDEDEEDKSTKKTKRKATATSATKVPKAKISGPKAWLEELVEEHFFKTPKFSADIREELETRSHHLSATDITRPLEALCHDKKLRRKKIIADGSSKTVLHWVNW